MSELQVFVVIADVDVNDRGLLLRLVSVLHRRGVEVTSFSLDSIKSGRRTARATFLATEQRAVTVVRTVDNVVGVCSSELRDADGAPVCISC